MLKLLVSALVAGSFPVLALAQANQPAEPVETKESSGAPRAPSFVDRGYLLPRGDFSVELGATVNSTTMKTETSTLIEREFRITSSNIKANLSYGIVNDLNVSLIASFTPNSQVEDQTSFSKTTSKGMNEPAIGLAYRFLKQSEAMPFDVMLGLLYSPKGAVLKSATTTDDGNVARGGDEKTIAFAFYRRVNAGEFGLTLSYVADGEVQEEDATSGDKTERKAKGRTNLFGTAQFEASEKFYVMAGLGLSRTEEAKSTNLSTNAVVTTDAYVTPSFLGGLRIIAVPQKAFVDLGITVSSAADIKTASTAGTSGKIKSLSSVDFSAGVHVEF